MMAQPDFVTADMVAAGGYELVGKHHEVYMSDPNRAAPEKMRTVLRQPVRAVERGER